ncbi:MAG: transposase [Leptospirillum sp.]
MVIRAIAKVSDSYRTEKKTLHSFKKHSAMEYDKRLLSFKSLSHASLSTIHGRITVPLVFGHYAPLDRNRMLGQADLTTSGGTFFLNLVIELPEGAPFDPKEFLGVDMGIVNLSTDSDGESFSGEAVDRVREKIHTLKKSLQKKGTNNAKRHLKKVSGTEARFKKDTNHCISKRIVSKSKGTERGIALEDLKGFNGQKMVGKSQKERFGKWAFDQLRRFITYKAILEAFPWSQWIRGIPPGDAPFVGIAKKPTGSLKPDSPVKNANIPNMRISMPHEISVSGLRSISLSQSEMNA